MSSSEGATSPGLNVTYSYTDKQIRMGQSFLTVTNGLAAIESEFQDSQVDKFEELDSQHFEDIEHLQIVHFKHAE